MTDSYSDHKVSVTNTLWIIIHSTVPRDFSRHISDAAFSVHTLRKLGVPKDNVLIFTNDNLIVSTSDTLTDHNLSSNVYSLKQLSTVLSSHKANVDTCMVVVGGHGSLRGIPYYYP